MLDFRDGTYRHFVEDSLMGDLSAAELAGLNDALLGRPTTQPLVYLPHTHRDEIYVGI